MRLFLLFIFFSITSLALQPPLFEEKKHQLCCVKEGERCSGYDLSKKKCDEIQILYNDYLAESSRQLRAWDCKQIKLKDGFWDYITGKLSCFFD